MKNYEPIEQLHMADAHSGALIFWLSLVACVLLAL